jgi:hypothetical protein
MAGSPDRRLNGVTDEQIGRLHKAMLRGLERRLARLEGRLPKPVEPVVDATETYWALVTSIKERWPRSRVTWTGTTRCSPPTRRRAGRKSLRPAFALLS